VFLGTTIFTGQKRARSMDDLFAESGALQLMLKNSMETMLKTELVDHLGYSHRDSKNKKRSDSRNGSYKKYVKTTTGKVDLEIPRDRDGTLESKAIPKYEGVSSKLEEQIISMYAKGMTTRDVESHMKEIYFGLEISPTAISSITEKILDHAKEWQLRPLH
jgi:transposase-like protein